VSRPKRIAIDQDICVGSQTCIAIAPEHVELADGLHTRSRGLPIDDPELVDELVESCPVAAIRAVD
jgi:ferredoxin